MLSVIGNRLYENFRSEEIEKARLYIKKFKVDAFYEEITRCCWVSSVQYELFIKNNSMLEIKLIGRNSRRILKFHKTGRVYQEDYEHFIHLLKCSGIKKGIYITTGVFDKKVFKYNKEIAIPLGKKVILEDGNDFIRRQLGFSDSAQKVFKDNGVKVYSYIP
ncbi:hypothetical protein [Clostridium oryzae]|uniref:Restriction endonuclease type IV Mrr domain-containing protein n=1 Tax=Clostridium oryzae TaxID=1450648 RepID=A0A1V4IWK8_9CLOT|nr:hypothetical protein [Clostridium oryzae]OPJ64175.1 hypothetical protein CLORY_07400 [Clostridium oryzae]